jgi:L-alanine-DL-glutamate epimerase-like enolase superfamily enzyme
MKILSVRSFLLSYPMPAAVKLDYYGGERTIVKRDAMLVRIEGANGSLGWGPGEASEKAHAAIRDVIAPFLEGRDSTEIESLRQEFHASAALDPAIGKTYSGVEMALYDLLGKERDLPVSELIGGRVRDDIRLYGSAGMYQPPEGYAREAAGIARLGFGAYKMRPALGPDQDEETIRLMREAVGSSFDIMVDAHSWWRMGDRSYSPDMIEDLAERLAKYDITWLEEPMPPDDHPTYSRLKSKGIVPLASGEHEQSEESFLDLIGSDCVDYVQADVVCQGGYAAGRTILNATAQAGLKFAFHSWGNDLEVVAAAQLGICWPETTAEWLEYPVYSTPELDTMYPFPLAGEVLREPLTIEGGVLKVPDKPGMGVDVDESVIERYPWTPGPWSYFSLISPPGTWSVTSDHSIQWADGKSAS